MSLSTPTVAFFGHASGTYRGEAGPGGVGHWRLPAAWRVETEQGKVRVWQVCADSKIPYDVMSTADKEQAGAE